MFCSRSVGRVNDALLAVRAVEPGPDDHLDDAVPHGSLLPVVRTDGTMPWSKFDMSSERTLRAGETMCASRSPRMTSTAFHHKPSLNSAGRPFVATGCPPRPWRKPRWGSWLGCSCPPGTSCRAPRKEICNASISSLREMRRVSLRGLVRLSTIIHSSPALRLRV